MPVLEHFWSFEVSLDINYLFDVKQSPLKILYVNLIVRLISCLLEVHTAKMSMNLFQMIGLWKLEGEVASLHGP